jgi:hypothetical protein
MGSGLRQYAIPQRDFGNMPLRSATQPLKCHPSDFGVFYSPSTLPLSFFFSFLRLEGRRNGEKKRIERCSLPAAPRAVLAARCRPAPGRPPPSAPRLQAERPQASARQAEPGRAAHGERLQAERSPGRAPPTTSAARPSGPRRAPLGRAPPTTSASPWNAVGVTSFSKIPLSSCNV